MFDPDLEDPEDTPEPSPAEKENKLLRSGIIGAVTDSAILGGLLGGDIVGGIIGDAIDGDLGD